MWKTLAFFLVEISNLFIKITLLNKHLLWLILILFKQNFLLGYLNTIIGLWLIDFMHLFLVLICMTFHSRWLLYIHLCNILILDIPVLFLTTFSISNRHLNFSFIFTLFNVHYILSFSWLMLFLCVLLFNIYSLFFFFSLFRRILFLVMGFLFSLLFFVFIVFSLILSFLVRNRLLRAWVKDLSFILLLLLFCKNILGFHVFGGRLSMDDWWRLIWSFASVL